MVPKIIKNESEYDAALDRINELMDAEPGTPEGDELELLSTLVELYEKEVYPIDRTDPIGGGKPDPADDENPGWAEEDFHRAKSAKEALPDELLAVLPK